MATIHNVDVQTLNKWLNSGEAVLVDVRETGEYQSEHIEGARNLPLSKVTLDGVHLPEHEGKKIGYTLLIRWAISDGVSKARMWWRKHRCLGFGGRH